MKTNSLTQPILVAIVGGLYLGATVAGKFYCEEDVNSTWNYLEISQCKDDVPCQKPTKLSFPLIAASSGTYESASFSVFV